MDRQEEELLENLDEVFGAEVFRRRRVKVTDRKRNSWMRFLERRSSKVTDSRLSAAHMTS